MIQNSTIRLRTAVRSDIDVMEEIERSDTAVAHSPNLREELLAFIETNHHDIYLEQQLRLLIEDLDSRDIMGILDLYDYSKSDSRVYIGLIIRESYRRHGVALNAIQLVADYALNTLKVQQVIMRAEVDNIASKKMFERAGFTQNLNTADGIIEYQLTAASASPVPAL